MSVKRVSERRLRATWVAGLSLAACAMWSGAGWAQAPAGDPPAAAVGLATARPMADLKITATIPIAKTADWVRVTATSVWVGSKGPFAVNEIDPKKNQVVNTVPLPGDPCGGIAADADNLWIPLCGTTPQLAKIDLKTRKLSIFNIGPGAREGGIAVGAGSVWLVIDKEGYMARIDPVTGAVVGLVQLPAGSYNPVFSDGRVWVTRADGAELTVVDAKTLAVADHVAIGSHPRFATAGAGAIWTLNQTDGSLSRIDVAGTHPVSTLQLQTPGPGGDIAYGGGSVWTTMRQTPLTAVDAARSVILCQWKGAGGDAVGVGHGSVWLTDLSAGTVLRIALNDIPKECRAANPGE